MSTVYGTRHYNHFCFDSHWNDHQCSGQSFTSPVVGVRQLKVRVVVMANQRMQKNGSGANSKPWHCYQEDSGTKVAEALPGIIGAIISWILNRAKEVVGWVLQNLWVLVIGFGGLLYMYIITR